MEKNHSKWYQAADYLTTNVGNAKKAAITGLTLILISTFLGCESATPTGRMDRIEWENLRQQEMYERTKPYGDTEHPPIELRF